MAAHHLVRKAAVYAPDAETHKAYRVVLEHTEDRVAYFLNAFISHASRWLAQIHQFSAAVDKTNVCPML